MWALSHQATPPTTLDDLYSRHFMQHLFGLTVVWQFLSHLIGRHAGKVQLDERDLQVRQAASRAGDWVLTVIVIAAVCALALVPMPLLERWLAPIVLANLLIGLLIARLLVKHLALTLAYRVARG
jgi:cell division protein FtsW (lipid II flippase)